jgi:hypothetical protein
MKLGTWNQKLILKFLICDITVGWVYNSLVRYQKRCTSGSSMSVKKNQISAPTDNANIRPCDTLYTVIKKLPQHSLFYILCLNKTSQYIFEYKSTSRFNKVITVIIVKNEPINSDNSVHPMLIQNMLIYFGSK